MSSQESTSSSADENKRIRPINKETVHQICSGQVVLSLAIAVKELLENAIDAGATNLEVRLKEYGADSIEVIDNGCGVEECNLEVLTLKHYTSKIKEFSDLQSVSTLGFRGEALSSLCALSDLMVVTRHSSADCGTRVTYDRNGHIKSKELCARQVGTTVTLTELFAALPVRRKEFLKNMKREFTKMCNLLYAYCLISEGVRISCSNQIAKGERTTVVSTQGLATVRDNVLSVFGAKQLNTLVEFVQLEPDEATLEEFGLRCVPGELSPFLVTGLVSRCDHGSGRSAADRQFYYVNGRPCEPTRLARTVNEVYHRFNGAQHPFVLLNVTTAQSQVDVNVTPDKRQLFLEHEALLLATVKVSLLQLYQDSPSTFRVQNVPAPQQASTAAQESGVSEMMRRWGRTGGAPRAAKRAAGSPPRVRPKGTMRRVFEKRAKVQDGFSQDLSEQSASSEDEGPPAGDTGSSQDELANGHSEESVLEACKQGCVPDDSSKEIELVAPGRQVDESNKGAGDYELDTPSQQPDGGGGGGGGNLVDACEDRIAELARAADQARAEARGAQVRFRARVADSGAEAELQRHISKDMFERMSVVGQFNKAFVVVRLDADLFIIDQHASDEKYNFEQLQRSPVLQQQPLVNPLPLGLTAADECTLLEHLQVFRENGFEIQVDEAAAVGARTALTAVPVSRSCRLGKTDVDELLFMLQEGAAVGGAPCRPSRVRALLASRACRKSVMVGTALSAADMRRLVDHMGQIDQPWNCPHGRPTMRHLVNLDLVQQD